MRKVKVSVVIPSYNSARYLTAAIDSVLAQTYENFEILVVDDGSTDETKDVLKRYENSIRYLYKPNGGVSSARNHGIENAKGEYLAFLDADDAWLPEKLEKQIIELEKNAGRACYAAFTACDEKLNPLRVVQNQRSENALRDLLVRGNVIGTPSAVIIEKKLLKEIGGFDLGLSQCADWEMWVRVAAHAEFFGVEESLVLYREHESNMSRNARLLEKDSLLVLEKGFAAIDLPDEIREQKNRAFARNYMVLAGTYFQAGRYADFLRCAARAVSLDIRQTRYLVEFPRRRLG